MVKYYAYCETCNWSGEEYEGADAEEKAEKDVEDHIISKPGVHNVYVKESN